MPLPAYLDNPRDRAILAQLQAFNQKHIEPLDVDYTEKGTLKVFNVGPEQHQIPLGGLGTFTIRACPKDRAYSVPLEIWRDYPEGKNDDMNKMSIRLLNGYAIAESIVSYGKFTNPSTDLRKFGVFTCGAFLTMQPPGKGAQEIILASELKDYMRKVRGAKIINTREVTDVAIAAARKNGDKRKKEEIAEDILLANLPTEAELEDAHSRLNTYCLWLVEEANGYYRANNLLEIQKRHRWAADVTGNTGLPWVAGSLLMTKCDVCGNSVPPDAAICLGCKSVVTGKELVIIEKQTAGYESLWDPTHPAYRGHKFGGPPARKPKEAATA